MMQVSSEKLYHKGLITLGGFSTKHRLAGKQFEMYNYYLLSRTMFSQLKAPLAKNIFHSFVIQSVVKAQSAPAQCTKVGRNVSI